MHLIINGKDIIEQQVEVIEDHNHNVQHCIPNLADGLNVIAGAGAWTLGNFAVLIATGLLVQPFDIHMVHVGTFSASDIYQLNLYAGANGSEVLIAEVRFTRTNATNPGSILPCITPLLPAGTQVKAKLACKLGGANVNFSVMYHTY